MNKLLSILPLSLALCGCSAFSPVVLENATIVESQNASFVGEPKRATATFPFLGTYTLTCNITSNGDYIVISSPMGNEAEVRRTTNFDQQFYYATTSDGFVKMGVAWTKLTQGPMVDITLSFNANSPENLERLNWSYIYMQEDESYTLGNDVDINELASDYGPEISLSYSWTRDNVSTSTFTFPITYGVDYDTFGVNEIPNIEWVRANGRFEKTFNAIYTDNTEPKLYAFWLNRYMLARQVRYNGDIINQNYVTGMDGLDPSFGKQCRVSFNVTEDVDMKVSATPYDPSWDLVDDYNRGYADGKADGEKPVSWFRNIFDGMASFFSVEIIPHLSLGLIMFAPLLVLAIIVIVRIFKHGG